jgi:hypothetical protein
MFTWLKSLPPLSKRYRQKEIITSRIGVLSLNLGAKLRIKVSAQLPFLVVTTQASFKNESIHDRQRNQMLSRINFWKLLYGHTIFPMELSFVDIC